MNPVLLVLIVRQKSDYFVSTTVFIIFIFFSMFISIVYLSPGSLTLFRGYRLLLVTVTALLRYKFVYQQGNL
jgi:hypothetical protein